MPYKHQTQSYRKGGWICWQDAGTAEYAAMIVADIRKQGFKAKREKDRVFVLSVDQDKIDPYHEKRYPELNYGECS